MNTPTTAAVASRPTPGSAASWTPLSGSPAGGQSFARADILDAFRQAGLWRTEAFFGVAGEPLTKPGLGTRYRARLRLERNRAPCVVYLKRFGKEKLADLLRRRLESGTQLTAGEHEMRVGTTLQAAGIPVAEPLAWGWQDAPDGARHSFVVLSAVPGDPAQRWVKEILAGTPHERWEKKKEFVLRLADLARRFHEPGWRHRDFYLNHIFVAERAGALELSLIDLQRVFRPRWRPDRWRIKDLAQLNFSADLTQFSRAMRVRFAHRYFDVKHLNTGQKRLLRQVFRKSAAIAHRERP